MLTCCGLFYMINDNKVVWQDWSVKYRFSTDHICKCLSFYRVHHGANREKAVNPEITFVKNFKFHNFFISFAPGRCQWTFTNYVIMANV